MYYAIQNVNDRKAVLRGSGYGNSLYLYTKKNFVNLKPLQVINPWIRRKIEIFWEHIYWEDNSYVS